MVKQNEQTEEKLVELTEIIIGSYDIDDLYDIAREVIKKTFEENEEAFQEAWEAYTGEQNRNG